MNMLTRTCKVRLARARLGFKDVTSTWHHPTLNGSSRHLCTSQTEHEEITCKNLAQSKRDQGWCYDPTVKYEALRQCAVPRMAYYDYSASDLTDSSDSEIEIDTITEEDAQCLNAKILAEAKEEQPFPYYPTLNYEVLKQFFYIDSPDSLNYSNLILGSGTAEEVQRKRKIYYSEATQNQLRFHDRKTNNNEKEVKADPKTEIEQDSEIETELENETGTETMEEEARKDKILVGTGDDQLFSFDPNIKYEPLRRYIVPRFAFFDSSSTDWSDSSEISASDFSDSESETETVAKKEAQSLEDKILGDLQCVVEDLSKSLGDLQCVVEDLSKSPPTNLQSKPAVLNPSFVHERL